MKPKRLNQFDREELEIYYALTDKLQRVKAKGELSIALRSSLLYFIQHLGISIVKAEVEVLSGDKSKK